MSKYKILWIDDKWDELESFKERCESIHGMEIVPCKYSIEGMKIFEQHLEEWSGVILDAKVLFDETAQLDQLKGLTYSINKINELKYRREVPYYIFTGQPDTASGTSFAEEHDGHYYEKDRDEDSLIANIIKNAEELEVIQIVHKYQSIFDTFNSCHHDLLRILRVYEANDFTNNSVLNDVRKMLSDVFNLCYERGLCTIEHNGTNTAECSRMMGDSMLSEIIPIYIQRTLHTCVDITNPGSHRSQVDSAVSSGRSRYLLDSLISSLLCILDWCTSLPPAKDKEKTLLNVKKLLEIKYIYENNIFCVEIDSHGIPYCKECQLDDKTNNLHAGDTVKLSKVRTNNTQDGSQYPYIANFKLCQ